MVSVASGCIIVATPMLDDPNFKGSVVYLVEHGQHGSLGLIVNRPLPTRLAEIWDGCPAELAEHRSCCQGGPVETGRGLLVHAFDGLPGATPFGGGAWIGGDLERLVERVAAEGHDPRLGPRLFLGHAGWDRHQLAGEIAVGAWTVRPASLALLTDPCPADDLWENCAIAGRPPTHPSPN